jgi:anti-sigma factor RsiW
MNNERQLKLQAFLDGELSAKEARQVESGLKQDPELQALRLELQATSGWLRDNPPDRTLPVSRDFYWSQIEQRIQAVETPAPQSRPRTRLMSRWWWRWLAPLAAAGLFFVMFPPGRLAHLENRVLNGLEVESNPESNVVAFQSQEDGITVVWVDTDL